ncbi:MAG: endonuclease NucS [Candidatus Bathyarchaeota archaeon]|nr:endonuclease NucS [Candidatus Bathyarchaeota archaeon]
MQEQNKLSVLTEPTFQQASELIQRAFKKRCTLIVVGNCHVHYSGRANSTLEPGERFLIVKSDGSLLVHRPVGYEPVNWQPSTSALTVKATEDKLEIHAVRQKPRETLKATFSSVLMVSAMNLNDSGDFLLHASEDDMHRAILLKPELLEEGFKPISWEKKVEPGFVDVYGEDKNGKLVVVEVKRRTASKDAVLQLSRYIEAIKEKATKEIRGVLVAPSLGKDVQTMLTTMGLEFKALDPKKCAEVLKKSKTAKLEHYLNST